MTAAQRTALLNQVIASLAQPNGATKILPNHLDRYDWLRASLPVLDIATDLEFQHTFSGLFRLRYMRTAHRPIYFGIMEANKRATGLTFRDLLTGYYADAGRWEVSFISKLLHIIEPNRPVWDSIVSRHLGLTLSRQRNLQNCSDAYTELESEMNDLLGDPLFTAVESAFSARFPNRAYTPVRILDVSVWGLG